MLACYSGKKKQRKKKDNIIDESDNEFKLSDELFRIGNKLEWILCEGCKRKEIRNRMVLQITFNRLHSMDYIQRISFDESKNIEYLAKGDFGEVHKATWIDGDREIELERIHNSNDKIRDILKEVKQEFIVIITITLKG